MNRDLRMECKARQLNGVVLEQGLKQAGVRIERRHYHNLRKGLNLTTYMIIKTSEGCCMQTLKKLFKTVIIKLDHQLIKEPIKQHLKH